jgi:hypothetical protein
MSESENACALTPAPSSPLPPLRLNPPQNITGENPGVEGRARQNRSNERGSVQSFEPNFYKNPK